MLNNQQFTGLNDLLNTQKCLISALELANSKLYDTWHGFIDTDRRVVLNVIKEALEEAKKYQIKTGTKEITQC